MIGLTKGLKLMGCLQGKKQKLNISPDNGGQNKTDAMNNMILFNMLSLDGYFEGPYKENIETLQYCLS